MAENKMKEVAKLLGLEIGEEFKIQDYTYDYKLTESGLMCFNDIQERWAPTGHLEDLITGLLEVEKPHKSILNEKEKEYLSNVIRPFRNRAINIKKSENCNSKLEYIFIWLDNEGLALPYFKEGTMYKGMELDKKYTLEELGL